MCTASASRASRRGAVPSHRQSSRPSSKLLARARKLLAEPVEFIPHRSFTRPGAAAAILQPVPPVADVPRRKKAPRLPPGIPAHLARLCEADLLLPDAERDLFRRMNFLKYRAHAACRSLDPEAPVAALVRQAERDLLEARQIRDRLVAANLRLVVAVIKKLVTPQYSFDELLSDGIVSLMQAVEKFDFGRGFRFSTYAYRAVQRNALRAISERRKDHRRCGVSTVESLSVAEQRPDESTSPTDEREWERICGDVDRLLAVLDDRERRIIRSRFAMNGETKRRTFQWLADQLGLSKERVRQLEIRALEKLRQMAAELRLDPLAPSGVAAASP